MCPGEELVLTCTSQGTSQRWRIAEEGGAITEQAFVKGGELRILVIRNSYRFTLMSVAYDNFESTLSAMATNAINNTMVECTGHFSRYSIVIKIAGLFVHINFRRVLINA